MQQIAAKHDLFHEGHHHQHRHQDHGHQPTAQPIEVKRAELPEQDFGPGHRQHTQQNAHSDRDARGAERLRHAHRPNRPTVEKITTEDRQSRHGNRLWNGRKEDDCQRPVLVDRLDRPAIERVARQFTLHLRPKNQPYGRHHGDDQLNPYESHGKNKKPPEGSQSAGGIEKDRADHDNASRGSEVYVRIERETEGLRRNGFGLVDFSDSCLVAAAFEGGC